jgi:P4 family phage/plasmid primase-like protien
MNSYIYLIQDGEFLNTDVYKVGRTTQKGDTRSLSRIKSYNKDTIQKYLREVNNEHVIDIENDIKRVFKLKYKLIKGTEWFDGNYKNMIIDIDSIINKYIENITNNQNIIIIKSIKNDEYNLSDLNQDNNYINFIQCINESITKIMNESFNDINYVNKYIYEKYKNEFKCTCIDNNYWYQYREHKWNKIENGYALRLKITSEVSSDYSNYAYYLNSKYIECNNESYKKNALESYNISINLKNRDFMTDLFCQLKRMFYDQYFYDNLDLNDYLLHFLNGVYDLDKNEFRNGRPEDNISMSTGINYIENLNYEHFEKMSQLEELINKILPISNIQKYVLTLLSSFLNGSYKENKFHIWIGSGSNGKSILLNLYNKSIGDYGCILSSNIIMENYKKIHIQLMDLLTNYTKCRFILLSEPEVNYKINSIFIKDIINSNEVTIENSKNIIHKFTPKFKLVLACNELPKIPSDDDDTWRNIRVVDFMSKFCDKPDPKKDYEFLIDRTLQNKLNDFREVFIYMLIQYYQNSYRVNGIQEPSDVIKNTQLYRSDSDIYSQFIEEKLKVDETATFGIDDIYPRFKTFLQCNDFDIRKHTRRELEKRLNKLIGKCNLNKKWKGWKLLNENDIKDAIESK